MNKKLLKIISFILVISIIISFSSNGVEAAQKTIKTKVTDSLSEQEIMKKAPKIKKGTTIVKADKKKTCYVKFTAPKTKTYKFTFKPVFTKAQEEDYMLGYFQICKVKYDVFSTQTLKTKGGKIHTLNIGNKNYVNAYDKPDNKAEEFHLSRSTKLKLKKGETIYISSRFNKYDKPDKIKYKITIK